MMFHQNLSEDEEDTDSALSSFPAADRLLFWYSFSATGGVLAFYGLLIYGCPVVLSLGGSLTCVVFFLFLLQRRLREAERGGEDPDEKAPFIGRYRRFFLRLRHFGLFFTLGFLSPLAHIFFFHNTVVLKQTFINIPIKARIESIDFAKDYLHFRLSHIESQDSARPLPAHLGIVPLRVLRSYVPPTDLSRFIGGTFFGDAALMPSYPPSFPKGYDPGFHDWVDGLAGHGYAVHKPRLKTAPKNTADLWSLAKRYRRGLIERLIALENGRRPEVESLMRAFLLGDQKAIDGPFYEKISYAGLAHIVSISGLHIGLLFGGVFLLVRILVVRLLPEKSQGFDLRLWAAMIALLSACFYTGLSGAHLPALRALVMVAFITLGLFLARDVFSLRPLCFAALLFVFLKPSAVISMGFFMSFVSVLVLITVLRHPLFQKPPQGAALLPDWLGTVLKIPLTSFILTLLLAPLSFYGFGSFSLSAPFANLLAIPLLSFLIMPLIFLNLLGLLTHTAFLTLPLLKWGLGPLLWIIEVFGRPSYIFYLPQPSPFLVFAFFSALFCLLFPLRPFGNKRGVFLCFAVLAATALLLFKPYEPSLLAAKSGRLLMVGAGGTLYVSSLRLGRFDQRQWARHLGIDPHRIVPFRKAPRADLKIVCDEKNGFCLLPSRGRLIFYLWKTRGLKHACRLKAAVLMTPLGFLSPPCRFSAVYDGFFFARQGAAVFDSRGLLRQTVFQTLKKAPWFFGGLY